MKWSFLFSLTLLMVIGVLCFVAETEGGTCKYTTRCSKRIRSTYRCGFLWLLRCSRYRTTYYDCTKTTPCYTKSWTCGSCNRTCGGGYQSCNGSCVSTSPKCCTTETKLKQCNTQACPPVNGGWSPWSSLSCGSCIKKCCQPGQGSQICTRRRTCTNPRPQYGGKNCVGSSVSTYRQSCSSSACTIYCTKAGALFPNPCESCSATYYWCPKSSGTAIRRTCRSGYFYNKYISRCDTNRNLYACKGWSQYLTPRGMINVTDTDVNVLQPGQNVTTVDIP